MKKFLAVLLLAALLCTTACNRKAEKDLSALEEFTSSELRTLIEDAKEVTASRFVVLGPTVVKSIAENMQALGYPMEATPLTGGSAEFTLADDPSVDFLFLYNEAWLMSIDEDMPPEFLYDCLGSMAKALADAEGYPNAYEDAERYAREFKDELPIESLAADQTCEYYSHGYLYSVHKNPDPNSPGYGLFME